MGQKQKTEKNTPGTAGEKNKNYLKFFFFCIYLLVMPKYWVKQIFTHGSFPKLGQKQKTEKNTPGTRGWSHENQFLFVEK